MNQKIQLFCIPYAGGNAEVFDELADGFCENIEVIKIEYSGHGKRRKEPFYGDFQEMTEDTAKQINELIDSKAKIAIFGYSMGSIVAYELYAQELLNKMPDYMFLASHEAPDVEWDSKKYYHLEDEEFFYMIQQMGGFERCTLDMLNNRFFRKLHFDPIKADYDLLCRYKMSKKVVIDVPSVLFYSSRDIPDDKIISWIPFLGDKSKIVELGENHFFIRDHGERMNQIIEDVLNV